MLTCLLVLSPLVDCCFTIFLKYSDTICWQHGMSSCNAAAIVPQHCCHFALLALVLVLFPLVDYFFLHIHKSWVASCAASCCNAAATDAALLLHITACCMATLVANTDVTATMTLFSPTNHQADAFCLVSWLLGLSLGAAAAWLLLLPVLVTLQLSFPSPFLTCCHPLPSSFLSIAITTIVHCHHCHHRRRQLLSPSTVAIAITVAIAVDSCYRHRQLLSLSTIAITIDCQPLPYASPPVHCHILFWSLLSMNLFLLLSSFIFVIIRHVLGASAVALHHAAVC